MKVQIQKWGNSLALRIPRSFAAETHIEQGSAVDLTLLDGKMIIQPIVESGFSLDQLLSAVTGKNLHGSVETGQSIGNEAW